MPSKSSSRSASLKKSQSKASLASTNSSITSGEERRSKGSKAKRRERAEEREERERSTTDQSIEEIEVVAYDGPRPDEEFLQASPSSLLRTAYGAGRAVLLGAVLFRSLPFVVYSGTLTSLPWHHTAQLGGVDWRVWVSGMVAGVARGLVENPFEALKTQKQVWGTSYLDSLRAGHIWRGLSATCGRNVILVTMFFVLSDKLSDLRDLPLSGDLGDRPFLRGSCITVCCWIAAWPFDVVKSQMQSMRTSQVTHGCWSHAGTNGVAGLLLQAWRGHMLYRGLLPGLVRACFANGSGMYAYQKVQQMR